MVRIKDIAKRMDVKMPTVSSMLKTLKNKGLVNYEKYKYVELTKDGMEFIQTCPQAGESWLHYFE